MAIEDSQVRKALIEAGHSTRSLDTRAELHSTLQALYHESPDNEDFVEHLRSILDVADRREWEAEERAAFMAQDGIKGCPSCDRKPTITPRSRIECTACEHTPGTSGLSLIASLLSWNDDEDWHRIGAPPALERTLYPFPPEAEKIRERLRQEGYGS